MSGYDAVVVGAGHNGLVCAAYLAAAGLKVKTVERRAVVGGAAVTEEFHPGFRNSIAAYAVSLLNPKVVADLDLAANGLEIVERRALNFLPLPDGRYLLTGPGRTKAAIAALSPRDAERYDAYAGEIEAAADVLRALALEAPPNLVAGGLRRALPELLHGLALGRRVAKLDMHGRRALFDLVFKSAGDFLDARFENDAVKALYGFDATVGNYASPYAAGSAYVLLHHCFGEVNGKKGIWGHAKGGMGAITQAMARSAAARGAEIETRAPVREILLEAGRAAGVVLEDGRAVRAPIVVANVNPRLLFERLCPSGSLPEEFRRRMAHWRCGSGTFRINVALSALPDFAALPGNSVGDHHTAGIVLAPSLAYMDEAYRDARALGWSRAPIVELVIPSTLDDSLAPPGAHVASLFVQHAAPELPDGSSWDECRDRFADLAIRTVDTYAPGFAASVVGRQVLSPLDLEREFGLIGGDIFHGAMALDQLFSARPMLGHADYRAPIPGLYMCGAGTHPGGGVTGAPGHNAARAVLADFRRWRR